MKPKQCQVAIVGGGPAGVCAAVAAARAGVEVVLLEQTEILGGAGVQAPHQAICGLYGTADDPPTRPLNDGLPQEMADRLRRQTPELGPQRMGKVYILPYRASDFANVLAELTAVTPGLMTCLSTAVVNVECEHNRIMSLGIRTKNGSWSISPSVVIDCSGQGVVIRRGRERYRLARGHNRQMAGLVVQLSGLGSDGELRLKVPYYLRRGVAEGCLAETMQYTSFMPGEREDTGTCKFNMPSAPRRGREARARRQVGAALDYLRATIPACRNARIEAISAEVLDREGIRLDGRATLTGDHVRRAGKCDNSVARNAWPIEFWDAARGPVHEYLEPGEYYDIPAGCMMSRMIKNLLCAGRLISADSWALASARVMGCCMAVGQAAGVEAARLAASGTRAGRGRR